MAIVTIPKGSVNWDVPVNENFNDLDARMPGKETLLDNWYFADPINERGIALNTAFTDIGQYFIDRWILIDGTVILTANGLVLDGTIRQKRETALNTNFTASVFASSGTTTAVYNDTTKYFDITCDGGTIVAAKLEIGDVSTIKRKDANGNWVLNDPPPNKALELAKCRWYFRRIQGTVAALGSGYIYNAKTAYITVPIGFPMRSNAIDDTGTIKLNGLIYISSTAGIGVNTKPGTISDASLMKGNTVMTIAVSGLEDMPVGQGCFAQFRDENSYIDIDANL